VNSRSILVASRLRALLVVLAFVVTAGSRPVLADPEDSYLPGDLLLTGLPGIFGQAIEETTGSAAAHIGIIARAPSGHLTVINAGGRVKEEPIERVLAAGTGPYAVIRPPFATEADREVLVAAARRFLGWPYDHQFRIDNDSIYCSELVYLAFKEGLGAVPVPLRPMTFAKLTVRTREFMLRFVGGALPEGEPGISPADYLRSPAFATVHNDFAVLR
jgi:hypothetical protein